METCHRSHRIAQFGQHLLPRIGFGDDVELVLFFADCTVSPLSNLSHTVPDMDSECFAGVRKLHKDFLVDRSALFWIEVYRQRIEKTAEVELKDRSGGRSCGFMSHKAVSDFNCLGQVIIPGRRILFRSC